MYDRQQSSDGKSYAALYGIWPVAEAQLQNAMQLDPANPRPYFLKGQGLKYTPEQFGGGCKTAMEQLQTAIDKYATFKPASEIAPDWGKQRTEKLLNECK